MYFKIDLNDIFCLIILIKCLFVKVVRKHFYLKRKEIREQCQQWSKEMELHLNDKQIGQSVSKSYIALKRHITQLNEELDKLEQSELESLKEEAKDAEE